MVLDEEFHDWLDSKRRIDLLCLDERANLVVVELKRDETGGFMELQAIRYASMVSRMRFSEAVTAHARFANLLEEDAEAAILEHLDWDEPRESDFAAAVRIILIASDFGAELTTSVMWLNESETIDITCVRLQPHKVNGTLVLDIQTIIPLPEATDYSVRIKRKVHAETVERLKPKIDTGVYFANCGDDGSNDRAWEDAKRFGFIMAGGGEKWLSQLQRLSPGDAALVYLSGAGYVGIARVLKEAVPFDQFISPLTVSRCMMKP